MSISVYKTFSAGEVLTAADLNASLTQIVNNGTDVAFPLTKNVSAGDFTVASLGNAVTDTGAANLRNIAILAKSVCDFRLTLTTGVPVTTSDVTAAETIYFTPYVGNAIGLYDGTRWHIRTSAEISIDVPDVTGVHDVFCYDNAGTATLEVLAWTNDTTRATALTTQDGILVKTGATTRRYVGTFYSTTAGNGQTEDSAANRYLWNYYNRAARKMNYSYAGTWTYTTATWREANGGSVQRLNFVVGVAEDAITSRVSVNAANSSANIEVCIGIGVDSTSSPSGSAPQSYTQAANIAVSMYADYIYVPAVGKHFLAWLEYSAATGTTTWGSATTSGQIPSISGIIFS